MAVELQVLAWSIVLGLLYVVVATSLSTQQRGLAWNASNRDGEPIPLTGAAARADRASRNFLESFVFFAVSVLAVVLAQRANAHTALGVQLYFWARLVYLPVYIIGIPYLRTLIWAVSVVGIVFVLGALF
ncbi:MAG TPA: MAPEG family protein [Dyella sp.]|uniref:MAPEG family protein n=1 Tax=Dyella sp. TaxID=1869338 RepID=UPI002D7A3929|nr:MAPEG family protein [Dyella sp.]HET6554697.1 MAPEG family protein [Dyella sp.]